MTLYQYLKQQLTAPAPVTDHQVTAQLHADGRISFSISAPGGEILDFWISDAGTFEKFEPMGETATFLTHPKEWRDAKMAEMGNAFVPLTPGARRPASASNLRSRR